MTIPRALGLIGLVVILSAPVMSGRQTVVTGGSNTYVQFNDSGRFGGDAGFTYNKTTDAVSGGSFTAAAGSGSNGFACTTNGCRVDLGTGPSDYLSSDGTQISAAGNLYAGGELRAGSGTGTARFKLLTVVGDNPIQIKGNATDGASAVALAVGNENTLSTAGAKVTRFCADNPATCGTEVAFVDKNGGYAWRSTPTLPTCASGLEGLSLRQSGGTSGARTKLCLCTSDGAGTPAYAWQNITSYFASEAASIGTTTTCP